jgi:sec-independent protein translocase protein TatA
MPHLGVPELLIILVIVIVIFGVGKLPQIGGAIGQSIREFRSATQGPEDKKKPAEEDEEEKPVARRRAEKEEESEEAEKA